jgi:transcriptional regulator with XRE-family HTH domain
MKKLMRHKLGEVIRDYRTQQGKTLRTLAKDSNISLSYLSELENGIKEASSEVLASLACGLGVPLSEIITRTGERLAVYEDFTEEIDLLLTKKTE